ncbi:MAG: tyrosine-type recombinase/integrase [Nanoarchaeota archaeon]|nr:tyrosine-type recombinase/integrase [Nanoarchaeota archaeon]
MKLRDIIETVTDYKASGKTMNKINDIFTQGDGRYLDPEYEAIVAGFIDRNAIKMEKKKIFKTPLETKNIRGPQKEMKSIVIAILKERGYKIVSIERGFMGGIPDVLAKKDDKTIAVECGPCNMIKAISYLEKDNTNLWILKPDGKGHILYTIRRSDSWNDFIKFHRERQINKAKQYIDIAFPEKSNPRRVLSHEEIGHMLAVSENNKRDNILLKCLYFLGLKNSETSNLKTYDIDFENRHVKVENGMKRRYIPIQEGFSDELKAHAQGKEGYLFPGRSKGKVSDRHIRRIVKLYAQKAGIRKADEVHPHTLRHSYATHLQNSGVPLNIIQNMLGHERLETTVIYTRMGVEKAREWVDKAFSSTK